jgi:hypothetical protein
MKIRRRTAALATTAGIVAASVAGLASPALADGTATCSSSQVCLYHDSGQSGAHIGFYWNVSDYNQDSYNNGAYWTFPKNGDGAGQRVKNNVASAHNLDPACEVRIYYNENFNASGSAPYQDFSPGNYGNLSSAMVNNNASQQWFC